MFRPFSLLFDLMKLGVGIFSVLDLHNYINKLTPGSPVNSKLLGFQQNYKAISLGLFLHSGRASRPISLKIYKHRYRPKLQKLIGKVYKVQSVLLLINYSRPIVKNESKF